MAAGERPPRRALGGVARIRRALGQLASEVGGRGAVGDLHGELLPRERGGRGDARRRVGREVARGQVDRRGEAPSVDVRGRDHRANARGSVERREARSERPPRIAQGGRHRHRALGRRRSRRHHDARAPGLDFAGGAVHHGASCEAGQGAAFTGAA